MSAVAVVYFSVKGGESEDGVLLGRSSDPPGDEVRVVTVFVEVSTRAVRERNLEVEFRR